MLFIDLPTLTTFKYHLQVENSLCLTHKLKQYKYWNLVILKESYSGATIGKSYSGVRNPHIVYWQIVINSKFFFIGYISKSVFGFYLFIIIIIRLQHRVSQDTVKLVFLFI